MNKYEKGNNSKFVDVDKMVIVGIRKKPNSKVLFPTLFLS
jgi:hypothetical protein